MSIKNSATPKVHSQIQLPPPSLEKEYQEPHPDDEDFYSKMLVFDSQTQKEIQEVRQKTRDGKTGVVTESVTRRIGDKWYKFTRQTSEDGETRTKESWCNVADDEIGTFKKEWARLKKTLCPGVGFPHEDSLESIHEKMPIILH